MRLFYQDHRDFRFTPSTERLDFVPHLHSAVEIFFFYRGSSTVIYGAERIRLSAGDVFVSFPNQIHGYEQSENIRGALLIIPLQSYLGAYYNTLTKRQPVLPYLKKGQWENNGLPELMALAERDLQTAGGALMQGYFHIIMGKLLSLMNLEDAPEGTNDGLKKILLYLNDHYTEPVNRRQIARAVGYSESYISHVFSGAFHTTIPEYVNSLRMFDAVKLLGQTEYSITHIASDLGFGSTRNFNRVFLKQTGITPKEYRQKTKSL